MNSFTQIIIDRIVTCESFSNYMVHWNAEPPSVSGLIIRPAVVIGKVRYYETGFTYFGDDPVRNAISMVLRDHICIITET